MSDSKSSISRILVVDDDLEIHEMLKTYLTRNGYAVVTAATEDDVREAMTRWRIDLIVLDVMLEETTGVAICIKLREDNDVPIIMLSALSADKDRLKGYMAGADDYIAKPFNPDLLLARIKAIFRRSRRSASLAYRKTGRRFSFNGWKYDGVTLELVSPDGIDIVLSRRETELLNIFLANPGIPLTRDEMVNHSDDLDGGEMDQETSSRAIDVQVSRLRQKLETAHPRSNLIKTVRGQGYLFAAEVNEIS